MIDLRYHIASIVAVFLALGLGILIGSTIVGDNLLVDQQKKVIDSLEQQFYALRSKEAELTTESAYKTNIINKYENYSQAMLPILIKGHLDGYKAAVVVCGDSDVPAGLPNALTIAGAQVVSSTVVLTNMKLDDPKLRKRLLDFYHLDSKSSADTLRRYIATSVGMVITGKGDKALTTFLQKNDLIKFSGTSDMPVNGVILLGGANNLGAYFADSFDRGLLYYLNSESVKAFGVENSLVTYSCMENYQKENISTVDNVDLSPGQVSLILAMAGEPGHYGMKPTAQKFMPSLQVNAVTGQ